MTDRIRICDSRLSQRRTWADRHRGSSGTSVPRRRPGKWTQSGNAAL